MKIVEISKQNLQNPFEFCGPAVNISKQTHVSVQSIYLELNEPIRSCLIDLSSSLVDKSVSNPLQNITTFHQHSARKEIFFTPTSNLVYKIQCFSLNEAFFKFNFNCEVGKYKINYLRIVLSFHGGEQNS